MDPGDVVAERFEVERLAGMGGMGAVYRARDRLTGEAIALKTLHVEGHEGMLRFAREAELLAELRHPGIVRYIAHGTAASGGAGGHYLAIEWLEGESLAQMLARRRLSVTETVTLGLRVAEALGAAHQHGIVHRDLKPGNLFLRGGRVENVTLLDFGVARLRAIAGSLTRTGVMLGTPGYMAPEQARGEHEIDGRADVFSLGCVLYKCLSGRGAFVGDDILAVLLKIVLEEVPRLSATDESIPPRLDELVARMLAKVPSERPPDVGAVADELSTMRGAAAGLGPSPRSSRPPALTTTERRVMCLVLAAGARPDVPHESTLPVAEIDDRNLSLRATLERHGGRLESLADGSRLVTVASTGAATDQAARAARCALVMRGELTGVPMALVAGHGVVGSRLPLGDAIDRGVRLLRLGSRTTVAGKDAAPDARRAVRLDEGIAGLLDSRFDLGADTRGLFLSGERDVIDAGRTLLGKATSCVGRDLELSMLEAVFDECATEPVARAVLVTGAPGVGKSRLRYELLHRLRKREVPIEIWVARGDPLRAGSPFGMIAPALRHAAGVLDGEPLELRRRKLRARVARHVAAPDVARVADFLGELIGAPSPEPSVELRVARQDAIVMGDQMRRAFEDLLLAETAESTVVLVLDDLHWGDLPSVRYVDAALRTLSDRRLMVLALARPEVHELFPKLWADRERTEIVLRTLSRSASERCVREVLGDGAGADVVARVVEQAAGNAFYLEELIRAVASGAGAALPDTVLAMVQARLDGLDPEARRVLRAGAVFGQVFWEDGVRALLGASEREGELRQWLTVLVERELCTRRGAGKFTGAEGGGSARSGRDEYVFRQGLVRDAAYAMLTDADRVLGHRLAGEWLERSGESDALVLAEHFERGGEPARAVVWYRRASEQALEGNDFAGVVARAQQGLRCGAQGELRGEILLLQAEAHKWRGEMNDVEFAASDAMRWLPPYGLKWYGALGEAATACGRRGHHDRLVALVDELTAAPAAEGAEDGRLVAIGRSAVPLFEAGLKARAVALVALLDEAALATPGLAPHVTARMNEARAFQALYEGDPARYLKLAAATTSAYVLAGDLRSACVQRGNVGYAHLEIGSFAEGERELTGSLASADRMGLYNAAAAARQNLGLALARMGKLDEARRVEQVAVKDFIAQGDRRMEGAARIYLSTIMALAGDLDDAEREATLAVEVTATSPPICAFALATRASVRLAAGRAGDALADAREAMDLLETLGGIEAGEALTRLTHARTLAASGDLGAARAALAAARDRLLARAALIADPEARQGFLERVPENSETLRIAAEGFGPSES